MMRRNLPQHRFDISAENVSEYRITTGCLQFPHPLKFPEKYRREVDKSDLKQMKMKVKKRIKANRNGEKIEKARSAVDDHWIETLRDSPIGLTRSAVELSHEKRNQYEKLEQLADQRQRLRSPGAYTLHVQKQILHSNLSGDDRSVWERNDDTIVPLPKAEAPFDKRKVDEMVERSINDDLLSEKLLYDARYDDAWKKKYTKKLIGGKKFRNKAGWVVPLQRICEKIGIDSSFFTKNPKVGLVEARSFILFQRLTQAQAPSKFLENDENNLSNQKLCQYFQKEWDGFSVQLRMATFNRNVQNDRDRVRLHGQYYNNIVIGKRVFGSGRKKVYLRTMIGGMERRFEILDNQVNHIAFTHEASDDHPKLCRNQRIRCRDSTRVVLKYPVRHDHDFIHANYIKGGPLFNDFIITQAPMRETIGDFWRMVWQERSPYIFMLISRKDETRCARYWPGRNGECIEHCGLRIINSGVNLHRSPLFRITYLVVIGPDAPELHVEHWQGDMNNSDNVAAPLQLLRMARNCSYPTIVHCHLGISRSAAVVAAEICISCLLKGPSYKHCVQKAIQFLRSKRPYCIETPMQYIFVHRLVQQFIRDIVGDPIGFHLDYKRWIEERAARPFVDDIEQTIPGYRQLSPRIDPDLIALVRHRERPDHRRHIHDCVGQMPIPLEIDQTTRAGELQLIQRYPRGNRYD